MLRQPVGVCATIAPFNFPGMIPFWYLPYAIAAGNTYMVKPSEKVPMTMQVIFKLVEQIGLPKGVINLVNGAKECVDAILDHPEIRAVTFVGSSATAKYLYGRAASNGKRVQHWRRRILRITGWDMIWVQNYADPLSAARAALRRFVVVQWALPVGGDDLDAT
jgi:acyl-CoA reductase-like NAD-dependent aldehyde dehydrogenase